MIKPIDDLLTSWGEWQRRLESGALGHSQTSPIIRIGEGRADSLVRRSRIPAGVLNDRMQRVDRLVRDVPKTMRPVVDVRYRLDLSRPEQESTWERLTGRSTRGYYDCLDQLHCFAQGWLARDGSG